MTKFKDNLDMANKFKDFGVTPIHLENKYSVKELDVVLNEINEIFFDFSYLYVNDTARIWMMGKIADAGKKIKNITWPISKGTGDKSRKEELLAKLREIYKNLDKTFIKYQSSFDILESKMADFQVAKYLKEKDGLDDDGKLKWIKRIHTFSQAYKVNNNLISVQTELLKNFAIWQDQ